MNTLDLSALPRPAVVETLDYETVLAELRADLLRLYPAAAEVIDLESEPLIKLLQVAALITVVSFGGWGYVIGSLMGVDIVAKTMSTLGVADLLLILMMLVPLSAIFASLLLSLSIYARSFKEAQNYMSPLSILMFVPLAAAMMPGVELTGKTALIPVMNVALAIKELIKGTADGTMIALIFGATVALAAALIAFCVHWFQQEKVLFR